MFSFVTSFCKVFQARNKNKFFVKELLPSTFKQSSFSLKYFIATAGLLHRSRQKEATVYRTKHRLSVSQKLCEMILYLQKMREKNKFNIKCRWLTMQPNYLFFIIFVQSGFWDLNWRLFLFYFLKFRAKKKSKKKCRKQNPKFIQNRGNTQNQGYFIFLFAYLIGLGSFDFLQLLLAFKIKSRVPIPFIIYIFSRKQLIFKIRQ